MNRVRMIINLPSDINKENDLKIIKKPSRLKKKQCVKMVVLGIFIIIILLIFLVKNLITLPILNLSRFFI